MTGFEMIATGGEFSPGAGTAGRVTGQHQASGRKTAKNEEAAFAGVLAATVAGDAAISAPDSVATDGATTDAVEPGGAESGSGSDSTGVAAAVMVLAGSTGEGAADLSTNSAGEGEPKVSGQVLVTTGPGGDPTVGDQLGLAVSGLNGSDAGKTLAALDGAPTEASVSRNLQTAVPAGTAGGAGVMDQTGTVPAGVTPAAGSATDSFGATSGSNSAQGGNPLPGNVLVRGVTVSDPSGQGGDAASQTLDGQRGSNQTSTVAVTTVAGSDQPAAVQKPVPEVAADQPAAVQGAPGQAATVQAATTMDTGTNASPQAALSLEAKPEAVTGKAAPATSSVSVEGAASSEEPVQVTAGTEQVSAGTEQVPGKETSPVGNRPVQLQASAKSERDGGSVHAQSTTASGAVASQTMEGSAPHTAEAGGSEGQLKQVNVQVKPAATSAQPATVENRTGGDLSQMSGDGSGSSAEGQASTGTGGSLETEAMDQGRPTFAWAADASGNPEMRTVSPGSGGTASQTARVELKDLPQFVRKAELVAVAGGPTEMRVQLVPENLGRMTVRISVTEGAVSAHLVVENPEVKAIVEQRLPELERSLRDQGLQLTGLSVGCGDSGNREGALLRDQQQTEWTGRNVDLGGARREYDDRPLGVVEQTVPSALNHLWTGQGGLLDALA